MSQLSRKNWAALTILSVGLVEDGLDVWVLSGVVREGIQVFNFLLWPQRRLL
jgi:hypothetical protein